MAEHKDIYYTDVRLKSAIERILNDKILKEDKKDITDFVSAMQA